jgi:hypothetical protein
MEREGVCTSVLFSAFFNLCLCNAFFSSFAKLFVPCLSPSEGFCFYTQGEGDMRRQRKRHAFFLPVHLSFPRSKKTPTPRFEYFFSCKRKQGPSPPKKDGGKNTHAPLGRACYAPLDVTPVPPPHAHFVTKKQTAGRTTPTLCASRTLPPAPLSNPLSLTRPHLTLRRLFPSQSPHTPFQLPATYRTASRRAAAAVGRSPGARASRVLTSAAARASRNPTHSEGSASKGSLRKPSSMAATCSSE